MTKQELKNEIEKTEKALKGAERLGIQKMIDKAKEKIASLKSQLEELDAKPTKSSY
jgi:hypothetical protein